MQIFEIVTDYYENSACPMKNNPCNRIAFVSRPIYPKNLSRKIKKSISGHCWVYRVLTDERP